MIEILESDLNALLADAKRLGSGWIILETPKFHKSKLPIILIDAGDTATKRGFLVDALEIEESGGVAIDENSKAESEGDEAAAYTAAAKAATREICAKLIRVVGERRLVVCFATIPQFDEATFRIIRSLLLEPGKFAATFIFPARPRVEADEARDAVELPKLYRLLELCVQVRMWNRAEMVAKELVEAWPRISDNKLRGRVSFRMGMIEARRGNIADAERQYENAIRFLEVSEDKDTFVKSLNNLGHIRLRADEDAEAEILFSRAIELGEELQSDYHLSVSYGNYARVMRKMGHHNEAIEDLRRSFVFTARSGYYGHLQHAYILLGECLADAGSLEEALVASRKGLTVCLEHSNAPDAARARLAIARILIRLGKSSEGEIEITTAEIELKKTGSFFGLMDLCETRGILASAAQKSDEASTYFDAAIKHAQAILDRASEKRIARRKEEIVR